MAKLSTKRILISAGETSGYIHASNLIQSVEKIDPNIKFYGMGSGIMKKTNIDIIIDTNDLSVFGALEVITKLPKILKAYSAMKRAIVYDKPDLLILVDYPGFNLRLAKIAQKAGVKVLYFISPKIWAWHQSRIKIIQKCVNMMAVIFPFEVGFYQKWQVPTKFVGNPLLKLVENRLPVDDARKLFGLEITNHKVVGLFPGSRLSEIRRLLPIMLKASEILKNHNPNIKFILSQAASISDEVLKPYLESSPLQIQVVKKHSYDVMQVCDAIVTASGTATLEIALIGTPLVIIYKVAWIEHKIIKILNLIKIPYAGLCNILPNKKIVQELLQYDATPEKITLEIEKILNDQDYRNEMIKNLNDIKKTLETEEKTDISKLVIDMITNKT